MATWENEFTTPGSSARIWLVLEVTVSAQSLIDNESTLAWQLRMEERVNASPFNNNATSVGAAAVNGSVFSSSSLTYNFDGTNETIVIASGSKDVAHNADGTKSISVSASYNGGYPLGTASLSASMTLPAIPRNRIRVGDDDVWKHAEVYVGINGAWVPAQPYAGEDDEWKLLSAS